MKKAFQRLALLTLCSITVSAIATSQTGSAKVEQEYGESLKKVVAEQLGVIRNKANNTTAADEKNIKGFVLSTHIKSFSDIPQQIDKDIENIKTTIRFLIRKVATDIELSEGRSGSLKVTQYGAVIYIPNKDLPQKLNQKKEKLLKANLKNSVSVRSAAQALKLLTTINSDLKESAVNAKDRKDRERIFMTQAIFVYEMANITVEILDSVTLDGTADLEELYSDTKSRVAARKNEVNKQLEKAKDLERKGFMSAQQFSKENETFNHILRANQLSIETWEELMTSVKSQHGLLQKFKDRKELILFKRDQAKLQLETLRDIRQVAELKSTIGSLDDIAAAVSNLDLMTLDELTVRKLLGYEG